MGTIRIIAGEHKGRKLSFPNNPGLRPTADRAKETLFNWLQGDINGAHCLDAFAGSGALGFEALSRGATYCDFIEPDKSAAQNIHNNIGLLKVNAKVHPIPFERFCAQTRPYDLIFLDPPFKRHLWHKAILQLNLQQLVHANSLLYIEHDGSLNDDVLIKYRIIKHKIIGASTLLLLSSI